jgi:putative membrane protein
MQFELNTLLAFISGVVWGFSLVVPGLSSSSLLIYMGLYENIMLEVGKLNMGIIIPLMAGILLVAVLFARIIDSLFEKHNSIASHAVIGLVLASTISIIPSFTDTKAIIIGALLIALGFVGALQLDKWQASIKKE